MLENFSFQDFKQRFDTNKNVKTLTYVVGGLFILAIGFLAYRQFIFKPAETKSKDAYWMGLNLAVKDSTDQAIDELIGVVKKYNGKVGGENAQFILGRQYMNKGEFSKALKELEDVDLNDTYISTMSVGLQGDCHSEMKDFQKAIDKYLEAAAMNENDLTTPMYLFKAGINAEKSKDYETAKECYSKIKDDYPAFANQKSIEKYIARVPQTKK